MNPTRTDPAAKAPPLAPVHDFAAKLRQRAFWPQVRAYVQWRRAVLDARDRGEADPPAPRLGPLSVNLDLTTACNYACDHCIDFGALNTGRAHDDDRLRQSLATLADRGLGSVILIGGGEPTVHPRFREIVRFIKELELDVAIVTNGSRNERILDVVDGFTERDWIRLSLDAGTDATFQAMHRPKKAITLEAICAGIPPLKAANPRPRIGFSFVICWDGAFGESGAPLVDNVDEIPAAARLARDHAFDYISFKPVLVRTDEGAEVMDPDGAREAHARLVARLRERLDAAKAMATDAFDVLESTNLKLLETGAWRNWTRQPRTCHMQAFRQVLSPLGLWNCPAHRQVEKARIADKDAWAGEAAASDAMSATGDVLDRFDASVECREVTCLYHDANWWLQRLVDDPRLLDGIEVTDGEDLFL